MPDPRIRTRVRRPAPQPDRLKVLWAVLWAVLITVVFVVAVFTLKGGFAAIVLIAYVIWLWWVLRRSRRSRSRSRSRRGR